MWGFVLFLLVTKYFQILTTSYVLLAYFGIILLTDIAEYVFDIQIWNQAARTARCYDWFEQYLEKDYDRNKDYSEGIFMDNYSMTLEEATKNKYEYIFNKLELKPGMKLLDAGCGTGVWMEFCRNRGVEVVGLTLSPEQAIQVRKKGLTVFVQDYRLLNKAFVRQFDRITALGSSEHVGLSLGCLKGNVAAERCNKIRINTWKLFNRYLKVNGKVYITVITVNSKAQWSYWDWFQAYVLERHYGGFYSTMEDIENKVIPKTGFKLTDVQDKTKDYHWSSVADKDHFGHWYIKWNENTFNKIIYIFKGIFNDLHIVHHWLYYFLDTWMWQFGGYQKKPLTDGQVMTSPMLLKYFMLEKI
jgi:cyclopropane fatty-acyl-phospholipid synthase-like methyltransferase